MGRASAQSIARQPARRQVHTPSARHFRGQTVRPRNCCRRRLVTGGTLSLARAARALDAVVSREVVRFSHQKGRLLSAIVRPMLWLVVFGAGFHGILGVSIEEPYQTYISYRAGPDRGDPALQRHAVVAVASLRPRDGNDAAAADGAVAALVPASRETRGGHRPVGAVGVRVPRGGVALRCADPADRVADGASGGADSRADAGFGGPAAASSRSSSSSSGSASTPR